MIVLQTLFLILGLIVVVYGMLFAMNLFVPIGSKRWNKLFNILDKLPILFVLTLIAIFITMCIMTFTNFTNGVCQC